MEAKHYWTGGAFVALALLLTWWLGWFGGMDPEVAALVQERDQALASRDSMSEEERRAQFDSFRGRMQDLTPEQRQVFFEASRPVFEQMALQRMDDFFAKPKKEQQAELDRMIDRIEQGRREREAGGGGGGQRGNRGNQSGVSRDQRAKQRLDRSTPEMRAKRDRFRDMLNDRRKERGLEPVEGGGRGIFRGGGRFS